MDFPGAKEVSFERPREFDIAEFTRDGIRLTAYYDIHSELIGTTEKETFSNLPASAQREITKRYKDYEVKEVIMFHDNQFNSSDMELYGLYFEDADNWFVRLQKNSRDIIIKVTPEGIVSFFIKMK
jgi:hypothetical protein